jgi:hypothetical protein
MSLKARLVEGARSALHRAGFDLVRVLDENHLLKQAVRMMEQNQIGLVSMWVGTPGSGLGPSSLSVTRAASSPSSSLTRCQRQE